MAIGGNERAAKAALEWLSENEAASVQRLIDWLSIPSISTDPAYKVEVKRAAVWCAEQLKEAGFKEVEVCATGESGSAGGEGHPIVLAHSPGSADYKGPHVLFYGHYDVQPVDPIELWESPPFQPVIREAEKDGPGRRIVARGAVDDKGQVMMFLEALRAVRAATDKVGGGVKFTVMIEGEEESGSVNLDRFVREKRAALKDCDVCLISDTGMLARGKPAITYGVRGLAYTEVTLHGQNQDLHSGMWGGRVMNPNLAMAKVLSRLHDDQNRVTIPGFYDKVVALSPDERKAWDALKFDQGEALKKIGLPAASDWGEKGFSPLEREWARPTAEINGIWGGYTGPGAKTVIPSHSNAKVSFRLVADQDPEEITRKFFDWFTKTAAEVAPGFRAECKDLHGGLGVTLPTDSVHLQAARRAISRACGTEPALIKTGGSIPVAGLLKRELGISTIFMGFGLDDDRVHSPNEKFELECFRMGCKSHAMFMDELTRL
ncbi:MAG: dipeptidase [Phycisphaerales bacterium]|nr:dipeptidase [Phycisphaerales bacterium]